MFDPHHLLYTQHALQLANHLGVRTDRPFYRLLLEQIQHLTLQQLNEQLGLNWPHLHVHLGAGVYHAFTPEGYLSPGQGLPTEQEMRQEYLVFSQQAEEQYRASLPDSEPAASDAQGTPAD